MAESLCCAPKKITFIYWLYSNIGLPWWLRVKEDLPANEGDAGLIPGLGRSPGGGNSNPFQYSCLKNRQRSLAIWVHGVAKELDTTKHAHACILQ